MAKTRTIETTVAQATAELQHRGLSPHDPVIITIKPEEDLLTRARNESRALLIAAGPADEDIDRMIAQARAEVAVDAPASTA
jgi:hypothetical protein